MSWASPEAAGTFYCQRARKKLHWVNAKEVHPRARPANGVWENVVEHKPGPFQAPSQMQWLSPEAVRQDQKRERLQTWFVIAGSVPELTNHHLKHLQTQQQ